MRCLDEGALRLRQLFAASVSPASPSRSPPLLPIGGGCRFKEALEVLTEAGDVAVADAFGDAGDREARGAEEFGGFFEAPFLQVGLESEAVLLAKEAGEIARGW